MPVSMLYLPRHTQGGLGAGRRTWGYSYDMTAAEAAAVAGGMSCCDDGCDGDVLDEEVLLLESRLHRPHTQPCQV